MLLIFEPLRAQKEGAVWYFGNHAGLNFKDQYPKPLSDGQINSSEGVAAVSDKNGNLLFYTDGQTVYNRNHVIMDNGTNLPGNAASTQSSIIVPKPGSASLFYIFTVAKAVSVYSANYKGLTYSIVDMAQNASLGQVTQKNQQMPGTANTLFTEKITAVKKPDGNYWILAHQFGTWAFYEYLLTNSEIPLLQASPTAGLVHYINTSDPSNSNASGYLKSSPNGNFLVAAIQGMKTFELFSFNNVTGEIRPIAKLPAGNRQNPLGTTGAAYGVEFSPTGKFLYGSSKNDGILYRWDISKPDTTSILNSVKILQDDPSVPCGALQLATNGKIYVAFNGKPYLGVIQTPDFDSCGFMERGASLYDTLTHLRGISRFGLPSFPAAYFKDSICFSKTCVNDTTVFYLASRDFVDEAPNWFLDGQLITAIEPSFEVRYVFKTPGEHVIKMDGSKNGIKITRTRTIRIQRLPALDIKDTTYLCAGQQVILHQGNYAFYGITNEAGVYADSVRSIDQPGLYRVTATNYEGCTLEIPTRAISITRPGIDSIQVTPASCAGVDNGSIHIFMKGDLANYSFQWQGGSSDTNYRDSLKPGKYPVIISIANGCALDTTFTIETSKLLVKIERSPKDTGKICPGDFITLTASGADSYIWGNDPLMTGNSMIVHPDTTTIFRVAGSQYGLCFGYDSIRITVHPDYKLNLGSDLTPCVGDIIELHGKDLQYGSQYTEWTWSTGETTDYLLIKQQDYKDLWLSVKDANGCSYKDSINITFQPAINLKIERSPMAPDTVCPGEAITLTASGASFFEWDHDPGKQQSTVIVYPDHDTLYRVTGSNGGTCRVRDSIAILVHQVTELDMGADRFACAGDTIVIRRNEYDPGSVYTEWNWSTGETTDSLVVLRSLSNLRLTVKDRHGCASTDSINITFNLLPLFSTIKKDISCAGAGNGSLEINVGGSASTWQYSIYPVESWSGEWQYSNLPAAIYVVKVRNDLGCMSLADTVTIHEPEPLDTVFRVIKPSCPECTDGGIQIHVTGGTEPYSFDWTGSGIHDSIYSDIGTGNYHITITDANGCTLEIDYTLIASELFIPNAFSPNGGTRNEKWVIRVLENRPDCLVQVYDRSGKLVFYDDQFYEPWDGTYLNQGTKLPAGTYFYRIRIDRKDANKPPQRGTVTILR